MVASKSTARPESTYWAGGGRSTVRVLVLEDDADLAEVLLMGLRNAAYATDHAANCGEAEQLLATTTYDVACVDLGLPDGDGLELVRSLGRRPGLERPERIIVITARDAVAQRVAGLDAGADDYLVKPFAFEELLARVRAVSRRGEQTDTSLRSGDVELDSATFSVTRAGQPVDLTPREFALLRYFLSHPGEVLSAEHLLEHVWDANADPFTTSVRVIISRLRRKLGQPAVIHTIPKLGYRIDAP